MDDQRVFCVIPAYNEEKNITEVIKELSPLVYSLIIVADGCSDATYQVAKEASEKFYKVNPNIYVLNHIINRGQGAALQTGNEFAIKNNAQVVVHFDADGQFLPEEIKDITTPLLKGYYDIVFGSRFLDKKSNMPFFKKNFIMPIGRVVNKFLLGLELTDPQNGFRAMNRISLKKIKINQDGSAHCSEILAKTVQNNLRYREVPITVIYNDFGQGFFSGKGRGKGGIKIVKDLIFSKIIN